MTDEEKKKAAAKKAADKKQQQQKILNPNPTVAEKPSAQLEKRFEKQPIPFDKATTRAQVRANMEVNRGNAAQKKLDRQAFASDLTNSGFDASSASSADKANLYERGSSLGVSRDQLNTFLTNGGLQGEQGGVQDDGGESNYPIQEIGPMGRGVRESDPVERGDILGEPNRGRGGTNTYGSSGVQGARGLSNQREFSNSSSRLAPTEFGTRGSSLARGETNGPGGASGLTSGSERNSLYSPQARANAKANRKQSRAYNLAYRQMLRQGDRVGALGILNEATDKGVSFGGVRQAGAFEQQAQYDLNGQQGVGVGRGTTQVQRDKDEDKKRSRFFD